jgi:hypothetical protein
MMPAAFTARNTLQTLCRFFIKLRNRGLRHHRSLLEPASFQKNFHHFSLLEPAMF